MEKKEEKRKPAILAVDDNPVNLRTLKVFLETRFDVFPVKSAVIGLNLIKNQKIDLILLDIDMPLMSGFEFMEEIKTMPEKTDVPVICITGLDATPDFISEVIKHGAKDFITKPFDPNILLTKIARVLKINEWVL